MRSKTLLMLAGAGVLFSACILSVNPFYTEKDATFDPRLVGEWTTPDSKGSCRFEDAGDKKYRFTVTEQNGAEGKKGAFYACLFKLKENLFLDITPRKVKLREDQADMVGMTLIPGHLLIRVRQLEPTLKADFFDWDWLQIISRKIQKPWLIAGWERTTKAWCSLPPRASCSVSSSNISRTPSYSRSSRRMPDWSAARLRRPAPSLRQSEFRKCIRALDICSRWSPCR